MKNRIKCGKIGHWSWIQNKIVTLTNKVLQWNSWDVCSLFHVICVKGIVHMLYSYICGIYVSNQKNIWSYCTSMKITQWKEKHTRWSYKSEKINYFRVSANVSKWFCAMHTVLINKLELKSMRNRNLGFIFANIQNLTILLNAGKDTDLKLE